MDKQPIHEWTENKRVQFVVMPNGDLGMIAIGSKHAMVLTDKEPSELMDFLLKHIGEMQRRAGAGKSGREANNAS